MAVTSADGRRTGTVRHEFEHVVAAAGVLPRRAEVGDVAGARDVFAKDGAVLLSGWDPEPDSLVVAAATLLGTRLRQVFPGRPQAGERAEALGLHSDGADVRVDVHGRTVQLRHEGEDVLLLLCAQPATTGGDSVLVDGYQLVDGLRGTRPDVHAFLTGADVDFVGSLPPRRGVPAIPRACRMVEYTRTGRRVVRASEYALPLPREPHWEAHQDLLDEYSDVLATAFAYAPRFRMETGELLVLDNYRYLHGRDGFEGRRLMHVLTVLSADAI
ncbi:TauD/TfdA family dioxygenase [Pseudonocardia bannensis]|uniref:TauD/TfdA family dioxygenase n=1 Tax=Pseudonocardia bannensis TaxID=630973 RepID=A0A848DED0_9PSEU|nr:TauD/TfdA family dioxygenase [Pseudonocardia bannensis]NMH90949.1 TauD/TfdA family dioxygenase [Pseudonocardia bannensis]